ncbi:NACHT, LRR and PYD domains-containing protein 3-like isoform X1 [Xiphophorus maculatus]|uniref:NACHT, LRR and PYD domains-containing protein 3-like isoform X1 n=1 Tax=Xiphophorus maculatus TaxID=8083 RepID=UPI000C6D3EF5|nr:NACHT, LRR and PYD domains-containing protein 3-like isoform X1 [Xiphophorus maculatus]
MDPCGKHLSQTKRSELGQVSVNRLRLLFEPSADARIRPLKQDTDKSDGLKKICLFDQTELNSGKTVGLQTPVPSPTSGVSMKSDRSMDPITVFKDQLQLQNKGIRSEQSPVPSPSSCVSLKSDRSMDPITVFKDRNQSEHDGTDEEESSSCAASCVSLKTDRSMDPITGFKTGDQPEHKEIQQQTAAVPSSSCLSMKSDRSMDPITVFKSVQNSDELQDSTVLSVQSVHHQTDLDSIFKALEESIIGFVKSELEKLLNVVGPDYHEYLKNQRENEELLDGGEEEQENTSGESFLKLTLDFLRRMKQKRLADYLHSKTSSTKNQRGHKSNLRKRFRCVFEGIAKGGSPTLLNQIYTELYMTEGGTGEVNEEHEVRQIEITSRKQDSPETIRIEDIFKVHNDNAQPIRTMLTKGVAGIGKTILTQKFTLDWAEDKSNQDIHFTFPFTFRELNVLKEKRFSLVELVHRFFPESKEICDFEQFSVLFVFDGLDECRLSLDFHNSPILTDVTESTSVDVLLINLIRGKLLPSARLWITTRPSAVSQIPPQCVDVMTEVRGFSDSKKEEYFRKRFKDKKQANRIVSHIKSSRSLHIMCHIPIFCWINATVLEDMLKTREEGELPKTLTEMYIHFLVVQTKVKKVKYDKGMETDPHWSPESRKMIESLGKLAFDQLQKGNLIFYETDLVGSGIDIKAASIYSGVFTQIFKEESGIYQDKLFCFIHLSVQEFLAALHIHLTFVNSGVNLLDDKQPKQSISKAFKNQPNMRKLHQTAVDKALQSPNGHLDLVLRILVGLSLPANQTLLRDLQTQTANTSQSNQETAEFIKKKISDGLSAEKSINLFHCLNELNDCSLVEEIQQYLRSGSLCTRKLSLAQWSALVFILLSSEKDLDVFDLKKYSASEDALLMLLPVVKASNKALLSDCTLSEKTCEAISSVLSSQSCCLREVDLSHNDLEDVGMEALSSGMLGQQCGLESLRVADCNLSQKSCETLSLCLRSKSFRLKSLDLNHNFLQDVGLKQLSDGLKSPYCKLESISLSACSLSEQSCETLASALSSPSCKLRSLNLSHNNLGDSGVKRLCVELENKHCQMETVILCGCQLSERCCKYISAVLSTQPSRLRELDLSNNNLTDAGVQQLSSGLGSPHCKLETLRLSGCLVTEKGCGYLASALSSNPSPLKELDLSYNHPGVVGKQMLSSEQKGPLWKLANLSLEQGGEHRLKPDVRKYFCELELDMNSVNRQLQLSDNNTKIRQVDDEQPYPDHPNRFQTCWQLMCRNGLTGRCYWEVEWKGAVLLSVSCKGIKRSGKSEACRFGRNDQSWTLECSDVFGFAAWHVNRETTILGSSAAHRVGVYLDHPAGMLSFYDVSSDTLKHLYTFCATFTEPVYPSFGLWSGASVSLCSAASKKPAA